MMMVPSQCQQVETCEPKRLVLSSLSQAPFPVTSIMLDLTLACNLRCRYCFKEKGHRSMSLRTAQDAIIWLIYSSGSAQMLNVFFMGGEPLLRWKIIEKLIPFAQLRGRQHGKTFRFSVTTNGTLVTDEKMQFAKKHGLHFHLSFDGVPEVQDYNRPLATGKKSSPLVEDASRKILTEQPNVMARGCVSPDNVSHLFESFRYFRTLGFTTIGLFPCESGKWTPKTLEVLEAQFNLVVDDWIEAFRNDVEICVSPLERWLTQKERDRRGKYPCGAGRGMTLIDTEGGIWPCSRFSSHDPAVFKFGNIYDGFSDSQRQLFLDGCAEEKFYPECKDCSAKKMCEGGCLVENLEETGDVFVYSPNDCAILRIYAKIGTKMHDILYAEKNALFMKKYYPAQHSCNATPNGADPDCDGVDYCDAQSKKVPEQIEQIYTIHVKLDGLRSEKSADALWDVVSTLAETSQLLLKVHFLDTPASWEHVLGDFCKRMMPLIARKRVMLSLVGVFDILSDDDANFFAEHDIELAYVHQICQENFAFSPKTQAVLQQMSGLGFRCPIVWYVDSESLPHIFPLIREGMYLNANSGFSAPLADTSPFFNAPTTPDSMSYIAFLSKVYELYVFYDDKLDPLNRIFMNAQKTDHSDFWQEHRWDDRTCQLIPFTETDTTFATTEFFTRLFRWQRQAVGSAIE